MGASVTGIGGLQRRLRAIEDRLRRPESFLRSEAEELRRVVETAIVQQRSPTGQRWAPKKDGGPALVAMANSVFASVSKGNVRVEIAHPAAAVHFYGAPSYNIPARVAPPIMRDGEPDGSAFWQETPRRVDRYFSAEDVADGD